MQLKYIAEKAEIHESTVSRAVANKYMHTPRGLFELKYFFSNAAGKLDGSEDTSTLSIKHKIKEVHKRFYPMTNWSSCWPHRESKLPAALLPNIAKP